MELNKRRIKATRKRHWYHVTLTAAHKRVTHQIVFNQFSVRVTTVMFKEKLLSCSAIIQFNSLDYSRRFYGCIYKNSLFFYLDKIKISTCLYYFCCIINIIIPIHENCQWNISPRLPLNTSKRISKVVFIPLKE